jgi:hypothetical protein
MVVALCFTASGLARAQEPLHVADAWAMATPPGASVGAVYLSLHNPSAEPRILVSASTPIAARVELHRVVMQGDLMKMEKQERLTVPPASTVELEPGGYHLMLIGLKQALAAGDELELTLELEGAEPVAVVVEIKAVGAMETEPVTEHAGHGETDGDASHAESE